MVLLVINGLLISNDKKMLDNVVDHKHQNSCSNESRLKVEFKEILFANIKVYVLTYNKLWHSCSNSKCKFGE